MRGVACILLTNYYYANYSSNIGYSRQSIQARTAGSKRNIFGPANCDVAPICETG